MWLFHFSILNVFLFPCRSLIALSIRSYPQSLSNSRDRYQGILQQISLSIDKPFFFGFNFCGEIRFEQQETMKKTYAELNAWNRSG